MWEDASNKVSYGEQRKYLLGEELDSVMNYPFKDGTIGFLTGGISAEDFADKMLSIMENYPKEVLYSNMNLLGTHDTWRVKTVLGGQYISAGMSNGQKQNFRLDAANETLAIKRLRLAAFMQMTFVGVPCIYYGDEIGMQGLGDPFNRMPCTWRCVDNELLDYYKKATMLRNSSDCLKTGDFEIVYAFDGVLVYLRRIVSGTDAFGGTCENGTVLCVVNRNEESRVVRLDNLKLKNLKGYFGGEVVGNGDALEFTIEGLSAEAYVK